VDWTVYSVVYKIPKILLNITFCVTAVSNTDYRSMLYSNGAVLPSYDVRLSVCLSVTLMIPDHIR